MDDQATAVRAAMTRAMAWVTKKEEGLFSSLLVGEVEKSLAANIRANERRALRWLEVERLWAEAGKEPDGRPYSVDFYLKAGRIITDTFDDAIGETKRQEVVSLTVQATTAPVVRVAGRAVDAVGNVAKGLEDATKAIAAPWPWWAKALGGAAVVGVVLVVGKQLTDKLPDLSGVAGGQS